MQAVRSQAVPPLAGWARLTKIIIDFHRYNICTGRASNGRWAIAPEQRGKLYALWTEKIRRTLYRQQHPMASQKQSMYACTTKSVSAGWGSSAFLRNDGRAVVHYNGVEFIAPELEEGINYIDFSVGSDVALFLQSNGQIAQVGGPDAYLDERGVAYDIEEPQEGICYTQVSSGLCHVVLLRSDGRAVAFGENFDGQCDVPEPADGIFYTQVAAGTSHTVLLQSDGRAVAFGAKRETINDQRDILHIPEPEAGTFYIQVSALDVTALLRSDGCAVVPRYVMRDGHGRTLPGSEYCVLEPDRGITYSQISAGGGHVVLIQSDGRVVAFGDCAPCDLPELEAGVAYTEISAGQSHTILLRSDGRVVAVGYDGDGECGITNGVRCGAPLQMIAPPQMILQLSTEGIRSTAANRRLLACHAVSGRLLGHVDVSVSIRPHQLVHQVAGVIGMSQRIVSLKFILPDGKLLHMSDTFPLLEKSPTRSRSRSPEETLS